MTRNWIAFSACFLFACGTVSAADIKKITKSETTTAATKRVAPDYPAAARQLHMEGAVEIKVLIDEAGSVENVAIVSGNPVLTRAAADAVKKWKFTPAKADGKPVKAEGIVSFDFKL
jgi:protein TonB